MNPILQRSRQEERIVYFVGLVLLSAHGGARLRNLPRADEEHRDLAQRARAEIARSVGEQVALNQLAAHLGASPFHLCRVFREQTGMTLHAFRLELRLRLALERLAVPHAAMTRVALDLGFSSHSHFSAMLRRRYGITPSALRRMITAA